MPPFPNLVLDECKPATKPANHWSAPQLESRQDSDNQSNNSTDQLGLAINPVEVSIAQEPQTDSALSVIFSPSTDYIYVSGNEDDKTQEDKTNKLPTIASLVSLSIATCFDIKVTT